MSNSKTANLDLELGLSRVDASFTELTKVLSGLEVTLSNLSTSISKAFDTISASSQDVYVEMSMMAENLQVMATAIGELVATQQSGGLFDSIQMGIKSIISLPDAINSVEEFSKWFDELTDLLEKGGTTIGDVLRYYLPETTDEISDIFEDLGEGLQGAFKGISSIFSGMSMGWVIAIAAIVAAIAILIANWDKVKAAIMPLWEEYLKPLWDRISVFVQSVGSSLMTIWNAVLLPIIEWVRQILEPIVFMALDVVVGALGSALGVVTDVIGAILVVLDSVIKFIAGVFANDWTMIWEGIVGIFSGIWEGIVGYIKPPINAIIDLINGLIGGIVGKINLVIGALNKISIDIPDWDIFGDLGGKRFGFSFGLLNAPQIPQLAKGAVLPANRPFMAMVGDQKHGTNIEAPLATIQEAVAIVMEDVVASNMAGHEATVGVLREILSAVLGIHIGDDVIGQAVARYNTKMAVMRGGYV